MQSAAIFISIKQVRKLRIRLIEIITSIPSVYRHVVHSY
jgi:hypothetical protein